MITGRPKPTLILADEEGIQLRSFAHSRTLPHNLVCRAKLVLWAAEGESNTRIARRLRWTNATLSSSSPSCGGSMPASRQNSTFTSSSTTTPPKVRTWLAQRPRYHIHYTPTYSSWLNQVERGFALITQRAIRRGSFRSVQDLVQKINGFVQHYNRSSRPFVWTATADSILEKLARLCSRISGTQH